MKTYLLCYAGSAPGFWSLGQQYVTLPAVTREHVEHERQALETQYRRELDNPCYQVVITNIIALEDEPAKGEI